MCQPEIQQVDGWQADGGTAARLVQMRLRAESHGTAHWRLRGFGRGPTGTGDYGRQDGEQEQGKASTNAGRTECLTAAGAGGAAQVVASGHVLVHKGEFRLKSERKF